MEWFNLLLNEQFLITDCISILKNISFIITVSVVIILAIIVIAGGYKEDTLERNIGVVICIVLLLVVALCAAIMLFSIIFYPVAMISAITKDFFVTKYSLYNISCFREILLNLVIVSPYTFIWVKILSKFIMRVLED